MKIIIGAVTSLPPYSPGTAWHWLQYALGFQKLGHEVFFIEEVRPEWCVDAHGHPCSFRDSVNRDLFRATVEPFGLAGRACQIYDHGATTAGLSRDSLLAISKEADLLINMSGHITTDFVLENVKRRVYVDQDPVYTQLWHSEHRADLNFSNHDVFVSVGLNIGTPRTQIPDCGLKWRHTLPPVLLEPRPFEVNHAMKRFTTIASWSGYSDLCYRGEWYRSKYEEFKCFAELPRRVNQEFEVALKCHRENDAGIRLLKENGWFLSDAGQIRDLAGYQDYIMRSRGEIGIAKSAYVKGRSGWFSDRTAHYLANGKPVLAQATGFEEVVETGRGLLVFSNMEEAVAGIEEINTDYAAHCRAAREFAQEYLDSSKALPRILEACAAS